MSPSAQGFGNMTTTMTPPTRNGLGTAPGPATQAGLGALGCKRSTTFATVATTAATVSESGRAGGCVGEQAELLASASPPPSASPSASTPPGRPRASIPSTRCGTSRSGRSRAPRPRSRLRALGVDGLVEGPACPDDVDVAEIRQPPERDRGGTVGDRPAQTLREDLVDLHGHGGGSELLAVHLAFEDPGDHFADRRRRGGFVGALHLHPAHELPRGLRGGLERLVAFPDRRELARSQGALLLVEGLLPGMEGLFALELLDLLFQVRQDLADGEIRAHHVLRLPAIRQCPGR